MDASFSFSPIFWLAGGLATLGLHRSRWQASVSSLLNMRGSFGARGRGVGLICGAACAHVLWVLVHAPMIHGLHGALGVAAWLFDPLAGASVLFAPLGALLVRFVRWDRPAALDADLKAWMAGLALARVGCVFAGCCGGVMLGPVALGLWPEFIATGVLARSVLVHPVALYECVGLALIAWASGRHRSCGGGGLAIAAFGGLRLLLVPIRAGPPHAGPTDWVPWVAGAWVVFGLGFSCLAHRAGRRDRQKSSPSSKPSRGPPEDWPSPMAPMPPSARSFSARRSFGVPSFLGRPRGGGVRLARNVPWRWPSRS